MTESHHHVQLTIESGELHRRFVCTAPEDGDCRRRPEGIELTGQESWTAEQATKSGYPCWAVEWVEAIGIEDAVIATPDDGVLASVPVTISFDEGVEITPIAEVTEESGEVEYRVFDAEGELWAGANNLDEARHYLAQEPGGRIERATWAPVEQEDDKTTNVEIRRQP